jgi:hypothetical protein
MHHLSAFQREKELIDKFGKGNGHLIFIMSIYLDVPSAVTLAAEALTDGGNDKKIDFIKLDRDLRKIVFAQGYFSDRKVDSAPANKASDLNTAAAWLISGDTQNVPQNLREIIEECRSAIGNGDIDQIDLLYVHNLPESVNVSKELTTVAAYLIRSLPHESEITVIHKELGLENCEKLYVDKESSILVKEDVECPSKVKYVEEGPSWRAHVLSVPGPWLRDLFVKYGDRLFSANYRGFLGVDRRRKINSGIKNTAERKPDNFWVFNNGITILTHGLKNDGEKISLEGLSIINGAQTTGSIGSLDSVTSLTQVNVLARIIECSDPDTIDEIVRYNNTQNKITTWDKFSNDSQQKRIQEEFANYGHEYSLKRGFDANSRLGIEVVAQPVIALEGYYQEANSGKNGVFESDKMYRVAFEDKKARHILFAYAIAKAIDERRNELRSKLSDETIIQIERKQLTLLRNLRFKYFLISVIGRSMNVLLGKEVDIKQIGFKTSFAESRNKTLNDLTAELSQLVNLMLTYTSTFIQTEFSEFIRRENVLANLSEQVQSLIYAQEASNPSPVIAHLKEMVVE